MRSLTPRQREVMKLVVAGHPSKIIAADLKISRRTVENHRASIMRKTGSTSIPALVRYALYESRTEHTQWQGEPSSLPLRTQSFKDTMKRILLIVATGVLMTGSVLAQQARPMPGMEMKGMDAKGMDMKMLMPDTSDALATKSYKLAMMKAMQTMPDFSGDADVDFMKHMRPHHQAAVDMAKVVLANGKDPDVKKLAQDIIAAQEKEITVIDAWLKK